MLLTDDPFIINVSIVLWIIGIGVLFIFGVYFFREGRKQKDIRIVNTNLLLSLFFIFYIGASTCRLINRYIIKLPTGTLHYEGLNLILITGYASLAFSGLFFIYFAIERDIIKRTHYVLSTLVIITLIISVINYWLPEEISFPFFTFTFVYPLWIPTLLALPTIYVILAIKSTGIVRKNAITVLIGIVGFEFTIAFNSPEATPLFQALGPYILYWGTPFLQMFSCYLLYRGFRVR